MRKFLFILLLFKSFLIAGREDIIKVRNLYYRATVNKETSDSFYTYLKTSPSIGISLLKGYMGMSYMIKANHSWNPYNKLSFFNKGKEYLNGAIEKDLENVELRFLRFCVQTNAPVFLAYSNDIYGDKVVILNGYHLIHDEDLKIRIRNYMKNSKICTQQEKAIFK